MPQDKCSPWWTPLNAWASVPEPGAIADAYEEVYDLLHNDGKAHEMRETGRLGTLRYDWPAVIGGYWRPFLERLAKELNIGANGTDPAKDREHSLAEELV